MNAKELLAMDEAALKKELADLMQRRDIARVRTILAQKAASK